MPNLRRLGGVVLALLSAYLALPITWAQSPVPVVSTVANRPATYRVGGLWTVTDAESANCPTSSICDGPCTGSLQLMCMYTTGGWVSTSVATSDPAAAELALQNTTDLHSVNPAIRCFMPWGSATTASGPRLCAVDAATDYLSLDTDGDGTADLDIKLEADKTVFEKVGVATDQTFEFRNSGGSGLAILLADGYDTPQGTSPGCVSVWEGAAGGTDFVSWCAPATVATGGVTMNAPSGLAAGTYSVAIGDTNGVASGVAASVLSPYALLAGAVFTGNVDLSATGVRMSAAAGVLTLLGLGSGTNEDLKFTFLNGTANTVAVTSSTGVTNIDFGSIGFATTGVGSLGANSTATKAAADNDTTAVASTSFVQQEINGAGGAGLACSSGSCATASLETGFLNSAANPTVAGEGGMAWDSNQESLTVHDGTSTRSIPTRMIASATIIDPDGAETVADAIPILPVDATYAPFGITILLVGIKSELATDYVVNFEEWTAPNDGAPATIESLSEGAAYEATSTAIDDAAVAAGSIVYVDLPTTVRAYIQVWIEYTINTGN